MAVPHVKMEMSKIVRASLNENEWVTSVDLMDAYVHIPIRKRFRKYFRFEFQGLRYEFVATPFGLATAPLEFTAQATEVRRIATELGFRIDQYLHDKSQV